LKHGLSGWTRGPGCHRWRETPRRLAWFCRRLPEAKGRATAGTEAKTYACSTP
jgi:hypothetical protein